MPRPAVKGPTALRLPLHFPPMPATTRSRGRAVSWHVSPLRGRPPGPAGEPAGVPESAWRPSCCGWSRGCDRNRGGALWHRPASGSRVQWRRGPRMGPRSGASGGEPVAVAPRYGPPLAVPPAPPGPHRRPEPPAALGRSPPPGPPPDHRRSGSRTHTGPVADSSDGAPLAVGIMRQSSAAPGTGAAFCAAARTRSGARPRREGPLPHRGRAGAGRGGAADLCPAGLSSEGRPWSCTGSAARRPV